MPFRPQSRKNTQHPDLQHLQVNGAPKSGPDAVSKVEALALAQQDGEDVVVVNGVNGDAIEAMDGGGDEDKDKVRIIEVAKENGGSVVIG